jgi:hypothetical protein
MSRSKRSTTTKVAGNSSASGSKSDVPVISLRSSMGEDASSWMKRSDAPEETRAHEPRTTSYELVAILAPATCRRVSMLAFPHTHVDSRRHQIRGLDQSLRGVLLLTPLRGQPVVRRPGRLFAPPRPFFRRLNAFTTTLLLQPRRPGLRQARGYLPNRHRTGTIRVPVRPRDSLLPRSEASILVDEARLERV